MSIYKIIVLIYGITPNIAFDLDVLGVKCRARA
jgi:hypothetical protein